MPGGLSEDHKKHITAFSEQRAGGPKSYAVSPQWAFFADEGVGPAEGPRAAAQVNAVKTQSDAESHNLPHALVGKPMKLL